MADDIIGINIEVRGKKSVIDAEKALNTMQKQLLNVAIAQNKGTLAEGSLRKARVESQRALMKKGVTLGQATKASWQYVKALEAMTAEQLQFAKSQQAGSRGMNKFGMYAQQVGYQVGDFFVQVQSGTSALVAFGQQGTQLAGLLPGVYGAVIGIGLSLGTMLVKSFMDASGASQTLSEALDELESSSSAVMASFDMLNDDKLNETFGDLTPTIKKLEDRFLALNSAAELRNLINVLDKVKESSEIGFGSRMLEALKRGGTREDIAPEMFTKKYGFSVGKKVFDDLVDGMIAQSKSGDVKGVVKAFEDLVSQAAIVPKDVTLEGIALLNETKMAAVGVAKSYAAIGGSAEAAVVANETAESTSVSLAMQLDNFRKKHDAQVKATNANLDAQLELMMKQYTEQQKIDALRDKENFRLDQEITHAKYLNKFQMDKKEIAISLADIARINYELSLKEKQFTATEIADLMEKYDLLQAEKAENDRILELQKKKLKAQKELNKEVEELAERLSIPFQRALELIRQAKEEATVGLDAFGGPGSFKYGGIQTYKPESSKVGKGAKPTTMEGPIKALERQIELSKALFGLEGQSRREQEIFMQLQFQNRDADKKAKEEDLHTLAKKVAKEEELTKVFEEQRQAQKDLADTIANSMGDALTSIVDGTKSVKDAFKDMARAIIAELYQIYVVKQITGMISSAIMGPAAAGGYFGPAGGVGGGSGATIAYADGGVVGSPTTFPMSAGRTGLMGEAGPEAIMPLKRGKDGKLGVQAEGGAGDVIIHQNFNFTANGDESVKKIIAQQAPAIANMTKKSILDDRRRGGQMKQAFG